VIKTVAEQFAEILHVVKAIMSGRVDEVIDLATINPWR
jgi:hypothetical protein